FPTLLMGATLPILVAHLVRRSGDVGNAVGLLYYVNTLGAGAACFAATLLLFPFLGLQGSVGVAIAMNCAVAIGALAMHWRMGDTMVFAAPPANAVTRPACAPLISVLALAAAGRLVSLSYEIFLFRTAPYASRS